MRLAGVGPGDEVITSPFSFVASANCAIYEGATPVFADIDPRTYNLDPAAVEAAITERTKAIVAVDIFGYPCELDPLLELCDRHGLALVEDACEALGARYKGAPLGSHGHPAVFAFYPNKQMTTGEGGAVTTNDEERVRAARVAPEPGPARDELVAPARPARLQLPPRRHLAPRSASGSSRSSTAILAARAEVAARYAELLAGVDVEPPLAGRRGPRPLVVRLRREAARRRRPRRASLASMRERGVATAPYVPSIHLQPYMRERTASARGCSRSRRTAARARSRCRSTRGSSATTRSTSSRRSAPSCDSPIIAPMADGSRMIFLGFGKYARADKIYALEPLVGDERGGGRRTRVWVEGVPEPIIASRTERTILSEMGQEAAANVEIVDDAVALARKLLEGAEQGRLDLGDLQRRARRLLESTTGPASTEQPRSSSDRADCDARRPAP